MTKILVVEDNLATARLLKTLLEIEGFPTWVASHEQEAWSIMQDHHPDAVLIDMHLAQAEGLDLLHAIRRDSTLVSTAVVMTSAMDRGDEAIDAGADAFLPKPFKRVDLVRNIQRALTKRRS